MTYVAGDDMSVSAILIYKTADFIYLINTLKLAKVPAILIMHGGGLFWLLYLTGIQQEEQSIETRTRRKRRRRRRRDNSGKEDETVSAETAVPKLNSHPLLSDEPLTIPPALLGNTATESHKII